MCQAFAGEQSFLLHCEERSRKNGYEAFKNGEPRENAKQLPLPSDSKHWAIGWDIAQAGKELW